MDISDVSSQCWWGRHCHAALVALVVPEVNPNVISHQLCTVEILSTFLTWKVSISGGKTFPQKVSSGLREVYNVKEYESFWMWLLTFALVAKLFPQEGQATAFSPVWRRKCSLSFEGNLSLLSQHPVQAHPTHAPFCSYAWLNINLCLVKNRKGISMDNKKENFRKVFTNSSYILSFWNCNWHQIKCNLDTWM